MAISINPNTFVISVPQADLTHVGGTLYNHDTDAFRLELKSWEDSQEGIVQPKTHDHNTQVQIVGVTYSRAIKILPPYSIEYEDGQYTVVLQGSNNNIFDVANGILVQNQVQVIPGNSAGLVSQPEISLMLKILKNKKVLAKTGSVWQLIVYDDDGITEILNKDLKDFQGAEVYDLTTGILAQELESSV